MSILQDVFLWSTSQAQYAILDHYKHHGSTVVCFLYFANCMKARLLEKQREQWQRDYKNALKRADFLLADGIALQLFYRFSSLGKAVTMPENLNGTDFTPLLLDTIHASVDSPDRIHVAIHTLYDPEIGKTRAHNALAVKKFEERFWLTVNFMQEGLYKNRYDEPFDWEGYQASIESQQYTYKILLLCTGTPAQEIRSLHERAFIDQQGMLVLNVWGLLDYIAWFEKRAPKRVIKARVLETFRRIVQHPKKNFHKFVSMFGIIRYWWWLLLKK